MAVSVIARKSGGLAGNDITGSFAAGDVLVIVFAVRGSTNVGITVGPSLTTVLAASTVVDSTTSQCVGIYCRYLSDSPDFEITLGNIQNPDNDLAATGTVSDRFSSCFVLRGMDPTSPAFAGAAIAQSGVDAAAGTTINLPSITGTKTTGRICYAALGYFAVGGRWAQSALPSQDDNGTSTAGYRHQTGHEASTKSTAYNESIATTGGTLNSRSMIVFEALPVDTPPSAPGAQSAPSNGAVVAVNQAATITFGSTSTDAQDDALTYTIEVSYNGGGYTVVASGLASCSTSHTPTLPGTYAYRAKAVTASPSNASSYTSGNTITAVAGGPKMLI